MFSNLDRVFFSKDSYWDASQDNFTFCFLMSLVNCTCDIFNLLSQTNLLTALFQNRFCLFGMINICHRDQFWSGKSQTSFCMFSVRIDYSIKWAHISVGWRFTSFTSWWSIAFAQSIVTSSGLFIFAENQNKNINFISWLLRINQNTYPTYRSASPRTLRSTKTSSHGPWQFIL